MLKKGLTYVLAGVIVLTLIGGGAVSSLAFLAPFHPGDSLFELQQWVEQTRLALVGDPTELAQRLLDLVERRLNDLEARAGTEYEITAFNALDQALQQAISAIAAAPPEARGQLKLRLATLAARLQSVLARLTVLPASDPDLYARATANAKLILSVADAAAPDGTGDTATGPGVSLVRASLSAGPADAATATPVIIAPHGVPFPPDATPGAHDSFLLTGRHGVIACASCHVQDLYRGTPKECATCHASVVPANHYPGTCDTCHTTAAWKPAHFNHAGFTDCAQCHTKDKPTNHYPGQCSACHTTTAWKPANFNHTGFTDCLSCHLKNKPAQHYDGQCSLCHSTSAWKPANFNHSVIGNADCSQCHQPPANHWPAPCARCHTDTGNWKAVHFDHSVANGADCSQCHQPPANHWPAPCTRCHTDTGNWKNAHFDHGVIGGADCSQCHQPPANHFPGACRSCHSDTGNWKNAHFDHGTIGGTDCSQCHQPPANHYPAPCRNCHSDTSNWKNASFDHSVIGGAECSQCHQPPANHFPGSCRGCHTDTGNWRNATFSHSFPLGHGGANSDCAKCHPGNNYSAWTCTACHDQARMDEHHKDVNGYSGNCIACHADGRKHD